MSQEMDYKGMRERVEASVRKEKNLVKFLLFAVNLGLFVLFLFMSWQMYLNNGGAPPVWEDFMNWPGITRTFTNPATSALVMVSMGWGVALLFQFISLIIDSRWGERSIRDRATGREMRKEMARVGLDELEEQQKRKGMMRLTDDGELEAVDDELDTTDSMIETAVPIQQNRK